MACIVHPSLPMNNQRPPSYHSNQEPSATLNSDDGNAAATKTRGRIEGNKSANLPKLNFPAKLQLILSTPEFNDIICWLPHGRAWRVQQQEKLESEVLPQFFQHQKVASFYRQVTGWGFHRVISGTDFNAYHHELFLRDAPDLCHKMKRPTRSELAERKQRLSKTPPDFYVMPPVSETASEETLDHSYVSQHMTLDEYKDTIVRRLTTYSMNEKGMYLQLELNRLEKRHSEIQKQLDELGRVPASKPSPPALPAPGIGLQQQQQQQQPTTSLFLNDLQSIKSFDQRQVLLNDAAAPSPSSDLLQLARLQLLQHSMGDAQPPNAMSKMALTNYLLGKAPGLDGALGNDRNPF